MQSFTICLDQACSKNQIAIVSILLSVESIEVNAISHLTQEPPIFLCFHDSGGFEVELFSLLLADKRVNVNVRDKAGTPLLSLLVSNAHVPQHIVESVLARDDLLLNQQDAQGFTALHRAANNDVLFSLLLSAGVNPEIRSVDGKIASELRKETSKSVLSKLFRRTPKLASEKSPTRLHSSNNNNLDGGSGSSVEESDSSSIRFVAVPTDKSLENFVEVVKRNEKRRSKLLREQKKKEEAEIRQRIDAGMCVMY